MIGDIVEALVKAGATPDMILAAVRAAEANTQDALTRRRSSDAARQRKRRGGETEEHHVTSRDVTATERDGAFLPSSPSPKPPFPSTNLSPVPPIVPQNEPLPLAKPNGFSRFWELYPAKVGKRAADRAFAAALKRSDAGKIFAGLERAKRSRKWRDGFIPNPATWLNQDRWLDEPEPPDKALIGEPAEVGPQERARRLKHYSDTREWKPSWGERPMEAA